MSSQRTTPQSEPSNQGSRQTSEIVLRVASAFVLAAIALGAVLLSPWTFLALVVIAGGILTWEWGELTRGSGFDGTALIEAVCVTTVAVFVILDRPDLALLIFGATSVAAAFGAGSKQRAVWSLAGLAYVAFPAWALIWLRSDPDLGVAAVLYLLAAAWTTDTASYVGGKCLGGRKLAPHISPSKTWSGFLVGCLAAALVGYAFGLALGDTSAWRLAGVSIALALACQIGDLLESAVKRHFGAKDMSQLIPGHGGLFDRIDSLLLASVVAALIALRHPEAPGAGLLIW